jgi:hypothetical protein
VTEELAPPSQSADAKPVRKPTANKELEPLRAGNCGHGKTGARRAKPAAEILAIDPPRWILAKVGKFLRQLRDGLVTHLDARRGMAFPRRVQKFRRRDVTQACLVRGLFGRRAIGVDFAFPNSVTCRAP